MKSVILAKVVETHNKAQGFIVNDVELDILKGFLLAAYWILVIAIPALLIFLFWNDHGLFWACLVLIAFIEGFVALSNFVLRKSQ